MMMESHGTSSGTLGDEQNPGTLTMLLTSAWRLLRLLRGAQCDLWLFSYDMFEVFSVWGRRSCAHKGATAPLHRIRHVHLIKGPPRGHPPNSPAWEGLPRPGPQGATRSGAGNGARRGETSPGGNQIGFTYPPMEALRPMHGVQQSPNC